MSGPLSLLHITPAVGRAALLAVMPLAAAPTSPAAVPSRTVVHGALVSDAEPRAAPSASLAVAPLRVRDVPFCRGLSAAAPHQLTDPLAGAVAGFAHCAFVVTTCATASDRLLLHHNVKVTQDLSLKISAQFLPAVSRPRGGRQ